MALIAQFVNGLTRCEVLIDVENRNGAVSPAYSAIERANIMKETNKILNPSSEIFQLRLDTGSTG